MTAILALFLFLLDIIGIPTIGFPGSTFRPGTGGCVIGFQDSQPFAQGQIGEISLDGQLEVFLSEVLFLLRHQRSSGIVVGTRR